MSHHDEDQENLTRQTPSQAEGEEDTVEAELHGTPDEPDNDLVVETPSQAEGSRETVDEMLDEDA